ncbi:MAG: hypothetical protein ACRD6X_03350 [Pyrinomonadaceae bacterium]
MENEKTTRECPYCKEEIKAEAIRCKHCRSNVSPEKPAHEGICPFCKEEIKPEAIKCKHCGSKLNSSSESGCEGCSQKNADSQFTFETGDINNVVSSVGPGRIPKQVCFGCELIFFPRPRWMRQCCIPGYGCWWERCNPFEDSVFNPR